VQKKAGITIVNTPFQHNDMRDTGADEAKASIQDMLDKFLEDTDNQAEAAPVGVSPDTVLEPGPVPPYVPTAKDQQDHAAGSKDVPPGKDKQASVLTR
jgi:hypothetical protein